MRGFVAAFLTLALLLPLPVFAADQGDLMKKIDEMSKELEVLKQQLQDLKKQEVATEEKVSRAEKKAEQIASTSKPTWLEIGGDYRFRIDALRGDVHDYMQYNSSANLGPFPTAFPGVNMYIRSAGQTGYKPKNDSLMLNRFGLNLKAKATEDVTAKARLQMYKVFGGSDSSVVTSPFFSPDKSGIFDGNVSHTPQDSVLRVDQAFATWSNIGGAPVWFSVGRRPSTGGVPTNIRQNVEKSGNAGVPGLLIDYAFDGMTVGVAPDINALPGSYAKVCYGRGFDSGYKNTPTSSGLKDTDMIGINVVPYDTDSLHAEIQFNRAFDMMSNPNIPAFGNVQANVGDIDQYGLLLMGTIEKAGPGSLNWFISGAISQTHPSSKMYKMPFYWVDMNGNGTQDAGESDSMAGFGLLYDDPAFGGEKKSHTGNAIYLGARYDFTTGTKIGLEYNHGSKNWIAFAPASDDLWASKLGTRGDVYEAYIIQEIKSKPISKYGKAFFRLGYQYYSFNYTGSNGWLGEPKKISDLTSTPTTMADVLSTQMYAPLKNASDIYLTFDVTF